MPGLGAWGWGEMEGAETPLWRTWTLGPGGRRGFESVGKKGFLGSSEGEEAGRAPETWGYRVGVRFGRSRRSVDSRDRRDHGI